MGPEELAKVVQAASQRGWEAMALAIVMAAAIGGLVWLIKAWTGQAIERENRMALRITALETIIQDKLMALVQRAEEAMERNSAAYSALVKALDDRPCFWSRDKQDRLVEEAKKGAM